MSNPIVASAFRQLRLKPCPASGQGVHSWVYYAAHRAVEAGLNDGEAVSLIEGLMNREPTPGEVENTLDNVRRQAGKFVPAGRKWPSVNEEQVEAIAANGITVAALAESSPVFLDPAQNHAEEIVDALFPGNPLLCVCRQKAFARPLPRDKWRGLLAKMQFIVPSPMSATSGKTKSGKLSRRCDDNTGARRFLVIEFDKGELDQQAGLLAHLRKYAPLALVVFSGSKSLHGWFYCSGAGEERQRLFMQIAVSLGADSSTWTRCQLVRMPDGIRRDEKVNPAALRHVWPDLVPGRQMPIYFNPEAIQ